MNFWDDKNVLELASADGCTTLGVFKKKHGMIHFKLFIYLFCIICTHLCLCVCHVGPGIPGDQKMLDPLELKLETSQLGSINQTYVLQKNKTHYLLLLLFCFFCFVWDSISLFCSSVLEFLWKTRLALNSQRSTCLCLPNAGIKVEWPSQCVL